MNVNKIMRLGSLFFIVVLSSFSVIKYAAGAGKTALYYIISAAGFFIVYLSYSRKK